MKKYIKPVTEELILDVQPMMDGASGGIDVTSGVLTPSESDATGEAESRRFSVWDDED